MKPLLLRLLTVLSLITFYEYFALALLKSIDYPPKCSTQSVANGYFPKGCYVDIDDVVTRPFCSKKSVEPKLSVTAVRFPNSNETNLYLWNWEQKVSVFDFLYSSKMGVWMSSIRRNYFPKFNKNNFMVSLCSRFIVYYDSDDGVLVCTFLYRIPVLCNSYGAPTTQIVHQYVKVVEPNITSVCNKTVILFATNKDKNEIWKLKYFYDHQFYFDGWSKVNVTNASTIKPKFRDSNIAISFKERILYIVGNNKTSSSQLREVWLFDASNITWSKISMISVPYGEEKLIGHCLQNNKLLLICSAVSCSKYSYGLNGWSNEQNVVFSMQSTLPKREFSFAVIESSIIIINNCVFYNLTFTKTKTIVRELRNNAKTYLTFEKARSVLSVRLNFYYYFLIFPRKKSEEPVLALHYPSEEMPARMQFEVLLSQPNLPQLSGCTLSALEPYSYLIVYGGVKGDWNFSKSLPQSEKELNGFIWSIYPFSYTGWSTDSFHLEDLPPPRFQHSASRTNNGLFVYGGMGFRKGKLEVFNDLWQLKLDSSNNWHRSLLVPNKTSGPLPYMFGHTVSWFQNPYSNENIVFGCERSRPEEICNSTNAYIVTFENNSTWSKVSTGNTQPSLHDRTFPELSPISCCSNYNLINIAKNDNMFTGYWLPFLKSLQGVLLSLAYIKHNLVAIFLVSDGTIDDPEYKYYITKMVCPDGSEKIDDYKYGKFGCSRCTSGSYSFNGSQCLNCPFGVKTAKNGSASILECKICTEEGRRRCQQGTCLVTNNRMKCVCNPGYNRDSEGYCTVKSKIQIASLSSTGAILLVVVTGISIILYKLYQIKKRNEANIKSFENVWNIGFEEIKFDKRLDTEISGAFGEVYRGTYRQIAVAIKKFQLYQMQIIKRSRAEFAREIEVMKTIRHPNVVMFFGGGKFRDGTPFLVMELMHRGSLTAILHNSSIVLQNETKFSFALDGARGMSYLHRMNPPRVHRDLKSANLLVSLDWTVRVADFGSARLVESSKEAPSRRKDQRQRGRRVSETDIEIEPLLDSQRTAMTLEVGTMQWLAPEVLARKPYGASVDVYR